MVKITKNSRLIHSEILRKSKSLVIIVTAKRQCTVRMDTVRMTVRMVVHTSVQQHAHRRTP
jgi:hypothetical protein